MTSTEGIRSYEPIENPVHIDPVTVIKKAENSEGISLNEGNIFIIRNFAENYKNENSVSLIKELTECSGQQIYETVKKSLEVIKKGSVANMYEGDNLILDQKLKEEKNGKVEFIVVNELEVGNKKGESVFVRMWKYGALKQLVLPEGNPDNQIEWEMFICLKDKLSIVIPKEVENRNGLLVAKDNGIKLELSPGDAAFLPLVPRQIISNNGEFTPKGVKYLTWGPAWGGEGGVSQKPVFWPGQIR